MKHRQKVLIPIFEEEETYAVGSFLFASDFVDDFYYITVGVEGADGFYPKEDVIKCPEQLVL